MRISLQSKAFLLNQRSQFSAGASLGTHPLFSRTARINDDTRENQDAVKVTLSEGKLGNQELAATYSTEEISLRGKQPTSLLAQLFNEISSVNNQLKGLSALIDQVPSGSSAYEQVQSEIEALATRFQDLTSGDTFKQAQSFTQQYESSLQYGAGGDGALQDSSMSTLLFGAGFIGGLRNGDLVGFQNLSQSLATLGKITREDILSGDALDKIDEAIEKGKTALKGRPILNASPDQSAIVDVSEPVEFPELVASPFHAQGDLSLVVRSYESKDIVKAAQSGLDLDPITTISIQADVDTDKQRERIEKKRGEQQEDLLHHGAVEQEEGIS